MDAKQNFTLKRTAQILSDACDTDEEDSSDPPCKKSKRSKTICEDTRQKSTSNGLVDTRTDCVSPTPKKARISIQIPFYSHSDLYLQNYLKLIHA